MPFKFNPLTSQLDLVNDTGNGVQGPSSSTDNAVTRWDGTTGNIIQNSLALLQDGGAFEAQGYITRRLVTDTIVVNADQTWLAPQLELELTGSIEIEADGEVVIL